MPYPYYTFTYADAGVHTFNFTLKTVGQQNIGWVDISNTNLGYLTPPITVTPAAVASLSVSDYSPEAAGYTYGAMVLARDAYGNLATNFTGTVHLSSSDPAAVLPADYTFKASDGGVQSLPVTFGTAGNQTLTVTDTANTSIHSSTTVQVLNYIPGLYFTVSSTMSTVSAGARSALPSRPGTTPATWRPTTSARSTYPRRTTPLALCSRRITPSPPPTLAFTPSARRWSRRTPIRFRSTTLITKQAAGQAAVQAAQAG